MSDILAGFIIASVLIFAIRGCTIEINGEVYRIEAQYGEPGAAALDCTSPPHADDKHWELWADACMGK